MEKPFSLLSCLTFRRPTGLRVAEEGSRSHHVCFTPGHGFDSEHQEGGLIREKLQEQRTGETLLSQCPLFKTPVC